MSASRRRAIRRPLQCTLGPDGVLAVLRGDAHPFALVGAWAGGRAVLGSEPVAQAAPPESLERVFGPQGSPVPPSPAVFAGGWVGYLGYAAGQAAATAARALPAWWFGYYDHVLVREPPDGSWFFEALVTPDREPAVQGRFDELSRCLAAGPPPAASYRCGEFTVVPGPAAHVEAVRAAVGLIHRGDVFQANITLRLEAAFDGDAAELFRRAARQLQPPYAAFLGPPGGAIASLSPELFLRRSGAVVRTSPIKGTAARSPDNALAEVQRAELTGSAKNLAENVMIVDLMRSDLSRVCAPGTVDVSRLAGAEPHPGVWHLVSDVQGRLAVGQSDADLIAATFPPGSVTGAPKVRALEIIGELEAAAREVYTGAIGFVSPVAGLELNVAIRTFEVAAGRIWLGAGGGIVADSDPDAEYAECLLKAHPLLTAIGAHWAGPDGPRASPDAAALALRPRPAAGIFTTLRVRDGTAIALDEHLDRLAASARAVYGKDLPPQLPADVARCLADGGSGRLRITVRPLGGPLQCRAELTGVPPLPPAVRLRGAVLPGGLGAHKWADRRLLAALAAGLAPGEQVLLTDADGTVLETDRGNVFAVTGGVLRTPDADGRILPGIGRDHVLAAARAAGLPVQAGPVRLAELAAASEAFVVSGLRGVVPVLSLDDPPAAWDPGPVAASLGAALDRGSGRERGVSGPRPEAARGALAGAVIGAGLPILLLDNYDSFTYNLVHLLAAAGCRVEVVRNDEATAGAVAATDAAGLVISPGPCGPAEAGVCVEVIQALGGRLPVLGVCLGHEAIASAYGATVRPVAPVHGKASAIEHDGRGIFAGLPPRFAAARYHSLAVEEASLPPVFEVSARTADGLPMAIRHGTDPVDGVQFHPESILTRAGAQLIANFVRRAADLRRKLG